MVEQPAAQSYVGRACHREDVREAVLDDARGSNRLLKVLPEADYERLNEQLRPRDVAQKQDLGEAGQRIDEVHFRSARSYRS